MGEDFKIETGNEYADFAIEQRLSQLPEFWALVAYLEAKGLLDRREFYECLNQKCKQGVAAATIVRREESQEP